MSATRRAHPGVLVAKVGYFGVKSAKVPQGQMGTKPAKVGHLAANLLKYVKKKTKKKSAPPRFEPTIDSCQSSRFSSSPPPVFLQIGCFCLQIDSHQTLTKRSLIREPTKCAKVGRPRARVKSAKVRPTPYVYYPRVDRTADSLKFTPGTPIA